MAIVGTFAHFKYKVACCTCLTMFSRKLLYAYCRKSQGMKQLMAGGGVALIGITLVPLLSGLFG